MSLAETPGVLQENVTPDLTSMLGGKRVSWEITVWSAGATVKYTVQNIVIFTLPQLASDESRPALH